MYQFNEQDRNNLAARRHIFQTQFQRHLQGKISEDDFRPIRLQQGLYLQKYAPMLRVAIPYGIVSANQLRVLAKVAFNFDKGYCHVTTRQNIQFNWIAFENIPQVLDELASADLHSIQTSGNCIRNITSDPFSGVVADEVLDPRPYCELIRQWSLGHPEFAFLPRKFKIAITGAKQDRAIILAHDIGLRLVKNLNAEIGFQVVVGGGLGRTPVIGQQLTMFVPQLEILNHLTAILRVYNQYGRRDNKYKARIKILVKAIGIDCFRDKVIEELNSTKPYHEPLSLEKIHSYSAHFIQPNYVQFFDDKAIQAVKYLSEKNKRFNHWLTQNTHTHKVKGYRSVTLSLKGYGNAPGDITSERLNSIANISEKFSFGVVRTTHEQNIILPDVREDKLIQLWQALDSVKLATPNVGTINDIICCPGLDFCSLANAQSIPIANKIQQVFSDIDYVFDIGDVSLNISGCMNACAHHHLANIGILGVDKKGKQFFQISLGGQKGNESTIGKILGPAFKAEEVPFVIHKIIDCYLRNRHVDELFIATFYRIGMSQFKEAVYGDFN
jgi:sulfite reductase (NADPH) hemoprotein beta-component